MEGAKESSVESGPSVLFRTRYVGIMMGKCNLYATAGKMFFFVATFYRCVMSLPGIH